MTANPQQRSFLDPGYQPPVRRNDPPTAQAAAVDAIQFSEISDAKNLLFDLKDRRFGKLVASRPVRRPNGKIGWLCQCDCGRQSIACRTDLCAGKTSSCGCAQTDKLIKDGSLSRKHGHKGGGPQGSITYVTWQAMIQRCHYEKHKTYAEYGAKGVTVCERWRNSFSAFIEDMGDRPSKGHTIDRFPNQNGNYEHGNCRWSTKQEQARNKTDNHLLTIGDETKCLSQWVEDPRCSVPADTLLKRLKAGWLPEAAAFAPISERYKRVGDGIRRAAERRRVAANANSLEAYCGLQLTDLQEIVLAAARTFTNGFTHAELCQSLPSLSPSTVRGRCSELAGSHLGKVIKTGENRRTATGGKTAVWTVAPEAVIA